MLVVLSPAKKLDFDSDWEAPNGSSPVFMMETKALVDQAKDLKAADLMRMMKISEALATLNVQRFNAFDFPFTPSNARYALDAFKGDVYVGLDAPSMDEADRAFANDHVRILSGLYGLLKPLDLMQAYRLEMGTKFANPAGETLYDFWGTKIADALTDQLGGAGVLVNLASHEYFKAVNKKALGSGIQVITPAFKEIRDGRARVISFLAKRARGSMARYIVDHRITDAEALKAFTEDGYAFNAEASDATNWVFSRQQP